MALCFLFNFHVYTIYFSFTEEGISVEELWGDLWIAQHCEQYIRQRIETLRHAKVPIKLWLLRAANCRFDA